MNAAIFIFAAWLSLACRLDAAGTKRPNVLFIAIDDRRDWAGYLHRHEQTGTPNIYRLAKMGTAFTRSGCAAPVCNPSRAALMSGMRPSTTGVDDNHNDWHLAIPAGKPLTTAFRRGGPLVCGAGKIYHESCKRREEWDDYLDNEGAGRRRSSSRGRPARTAREDGVGGITFAPLDCEDNDLPDDKITDYGIGQLGKAQDRPFFLAVGLHQPHMAWNVPKK